MAQLDALEKWMIEKGPQARRVVGLPVDAEEQDEEDTNSDKDAIVGKSMCKVLLEDGRGERCYGIEVKSIEEIRVGMSLGCKVFGLLGDGVND